MKRHFVLPLVVIAFAARPAAAQRSEDLFGAPEVRTQASASHTIAPDLVTMMITFSAVGSSPREAGSRVAARADSIRRALQGLGIPRDSVVSRSRWYYWSGRIEPVLGEVRYINPPPGFQGQKQERDTLYRAKDVMQLRIRDISKVGAAIDTLLSFRVTDIGELVFTASKTDSVRDEALREAASRARRQAQTMADAAGAKLGRLLSLNTEPTYSNQRDFGGSFQLDAVVVTGQAGQATNRTQVVEPQVPIAVTVFARWELIPK